MKRQVAMSRLESWALPLILILAVAIRLATADYSLWFDELASLVFAHQPLRHLWGGWMARESNPPLYYTLLKGWMALVGEGDVALRGLSILIGLAGIGAAWSIAQRLGGRTAALIATLWLALSPVQIGFSQEVRSYALAATAALIAIRAMIGILNGRRLWFVLYMAAALVALYAHTTMLVFVAIAGAAMLWLLRDRPRALGTWVAANIAVAAGWSWWAWISIGQVARHSDTIAWIARPTLADSWRMTEAAYLPFTKAIIGGWGIGLLLAAMLLAIGWLATRDRRPAVLLLTMLVLGAPCLLFALSQVQPVFLVRTLYWASAPAWILIAVALARHAPRRTIVIVAAMIVLIEIGAIVRWLPARQLEAWPDALIAIDHQRADAIVFVEGDAMALGAAHYRDRLAPHLAIVAIAPDDRDDRWADGLYRGPHVSPAGAAALLSRTGCAFALMRGAHDPAAAFRDAGEGQVIPAFTGGRQPFVWRWCAR